jgi:hypothetical protein
MLNILNTKLITSSIFAIIIIFFLLLVTPYILNSSVNAQSSSSSKTDPSKQKFEVSKYLKIDEGQTYLEEGTSSIEGEKNTERATKGIASFIILFIELLTRIIASFALLFIIAGGITMMVSHGNQHLQSKGKNMLIFAIVGLAIAFFSLIIISYVQSIFFT